MAGKATEKNRRVHFRSSCLRFYVEASLIEKNAEFGRLKRRMGRCLSPSKAALAPSAFAAGVLPLPVLPIALSPIGKARARGFGIRTRNRDGRGAPESLPPKSEIGDGR
jgi:hypothetical protein